MQIIFFILKKYYVDLVTIFFFLILYPLFVDSRFIQSQQSPPLYISRILFILGVCGIVGHYYKLKELDPLIVASGLKDKVKFTVLRLISGLVVMPLIPLFSLTLLVNGEINDVEFFGSYLFLAAFSGVIVWKYGVGRKTQMSASQKNIGHGLLILYELTLYTLFLKSFNLSIPDLNITLTRFFVLIVPYSLLFFGLLLPATFGCFLENFIRRGSLIKTLFEVYLRFLFLRYIPIFWSFYLMSAKSWGS